MAVNTYSIKKDFSVLNALWLYNTISGETPSNYLYTFIGRTEPWVNESEPLMPYDNVRDFIDTWKNMISLKRVNYTDMTLAIRKITWTANTIYDMYDDLDPQLNEEDYYVVNSSNQVYKCLSNNNGSPSTVEPNSNSLVPWETSDGYKWQLMYKISDADVTKWNNDKVLPVKHLTADDGSIQWQVQSSAIPGTIDCIVIENGGSGYLSSPTINIIGDGTGASARAVITGGVITKVIIENRGSGYTYATVNVSGNASLRAIISPVNGHGSNAVEELDGRYLIIRSLFDKDEDGTFPTDISFRQIGLLLNPENVNGTPAIASAGIRQITNISIDNSSANYIYNERIINQTNNSTAILSSKGEGILGITNIKGSFNIGDSILGENSGITSTVSGVAEGTLKLYSGNMLYAENREAVSRLGTQAETYKVVIGF